jgi:hypothetical protein
MLQGVKEREGLTIEARFAMIGLEIKRVSR